MMTLNRLLYPRSVAFIGGSECDVAIRKTRDLGFTGQIWAIHPKRDELGGIATIDSVNRISESVDAAFIAVRRELTIEIVRELRKIGCGGAVIYASGFAETGNTDLQASLLHAADGMPLMGPNCYGFVSGLARVALWPDEHGIEPVERGVAIITQSGNIACNFSMTRRALPLAAVFAIGNQADVDMARMLESLAEDDRITAVGLHIEGLKEIPSFARAAAIARQLRKPVIALKTGRSEQGAKVAMSHTSSLAGADTLYDALFDRYGIARMKSVTAFVETLKSLHYGGPINDRRLVSMSCSGGEAALVADMALERQVSLPPFDDRSREAVKATLNEYVSVENPLDYHTFIWNQEDRLTATFSAVLRSGYDVAMLVLDIPTHPQMNPATWLVTAKALMNAADITGARAALVASLPECLPPDLAGEMARHGIAPMAGLDDALTAFEAAAFIGQNWACEEPVPIEGRPTPSPSKIRTLEEFEAKQLLSGFGLRVPRGCVCPSGEAAKEARALGFPVTLKTSSSEILHKSDVGGVALNLKTEEDVEAAARRLSQLGPRVLVEEMVHGAVAELIIGLKLDPQFGLALVVGSGGVFTELLKDSVTILLPTSRAEIERRVRRLKAWRLIEGFRGKAGNAKATFDSIEAVSRFAAAHAGRIEELDINPLLVTPTEAIAVDALLRMRMS
jgi:acyl-CoA synthetase (NDP forming)